MCGFVTNDMLISRSSEWRAFNAVENEKRNRVGAPRSNAVGDYGLSTMIGTNFSDIKGKVSTERKFQFRRMSKWQSRITNSKKRKNLNIAMSTLANLCSHLHIPKNVKEQTATYYRKALKKELVKGRSIESIMGACLYAACRSMRVQRSLKEISNFISYKTNELAKCYRLVNAALNLDVPQIKAQNLVPKIAGKCDIEPSIQRDAIEILREAGVRKFTAGKSPSGLAAGALYIACKQNDAGVIQKDIAYAAGVSDVTIRNRYKGLVRELDLQI